MRAAVAAALVLIAATPAAAQRGVVTGVRVAVQNDGRPAVFTVTGSNPCGAVRIDYGDGQVVTHAITGVPATIEHAYDRAGTYRIAAEGMGNCDGRAEGTARAVVGLGQPAPPAQAVRRDDAEVQTRFRGMDRDGDGVITRAEWRGNRQSFDQHDWNGDGVLSGDEVRSDRADGDDRRGEVVDRADFSDWTEARFRELDANRDGRLTRAEWRYDPEQFRRADWNGDGQLSRAEFLGDSSAGRREGDADDAAAGERFDRLDVNNDGIISRGEWRNTAGTFDRRDANRDGVITRPEFEDTRRAGESSRVVTVSGQVRWNQTGVQVRRGDLVRFDGAGTIQLSTNGRDTSDVRGARSGRVAQNAPLPDAPAGSLIARVGDSAPFLVGGEGSVRMPRDGELLLAVNDDYLDDNRGTYRVTVTVSR